MSTGNIKEKMFQGSEVPLVRGADNLTAIYELIVKTSDVKWRLHLLRPSPSLRFILKNLNFTTVMT
jgi:hypothetical protein